jgi:copper chaperone CopZ
MKTLFVSFALIMSSFLSFAQIQSASLTASGLTCSMCSKSIFKALEKLASVQSVEVDIDQSVFQIQFKDKAHVQPDDIKKAVTDAGFAIASLHIKAHFPMLNLAKDAHNTYAGATYHLLNEAKQAPNGDVAFRIVDKGFVPDAAFKQYKKMTSMHCIETGKLASCCPKDASIGSRVYHILF